MAKIKKLAPTGTYARIDDASRKMKERADCGPRALAILAGVPYAQAHAALKAAGRQDRGGTWPGHMTKAMRALGFYLVAVNLNAIIAEYPEPHNALKNVTSYHPRRFRKVWRDKPDMLLESESHYLAFKGGKVHDWSANRALRIKHAYKIVRL